MNIARITGASEASEDMPQRTVASQKRVLDPGARLKEGRRRQDLALTCLELSPSSRDSRSVRSQAPRSNARVSAYLLSDGRHR
jgi:hypothetical protein